MNCAPSAIFLWAAPADPLAERHREAKRSGRIDRFGIARYRPAALVRSIAARREYFPTLSRLTVPRSIEPARALPDELRRAAPIRRRDWDFGLSSAERNDDQGDEIMNRNALYLIIGILIVAAVTMGYQLYGERQKTDRIEIDVGKHGISIEKK